MSETGIKKKRKKKKKKLDKVDLLINYHCRFVSAETSHDDSLANDEQFKGDSYECNLTGDEVRSFYENIVNSAASTNSRIKDGVQAAEGNSEEHDTSVVQVEGNGNLKEQGESVRPKRNDKNTDILPISSKQTPTGKKSKVKKDITQCSDMDSVKKLIANIFKLCGSDSNIHELKNTLKAIRSRADYAIILNASDQYGWTALMCAAADGCIEIVKHLVEVEGMSYENITDKSGCSIYDICKRRQQWHVQEYLTTVAPAPTKKQWASDRHRRQMSKPEAEIIQCPVCGTEYKSHEHKQHESSMVHLFKDSTKQIPHQWYALPESNVGFQMMRRTGWRVDEGLGPEGSGRKNPIKTVLKQDRAGLGLVENPAKRISHFDAFDHSAVSKKVKCRPGTTTTSSSRSRTNDRSSDISKMNLDKNIPKKDKNWERNMRRYLSSDD